MAMHIYSAITQESIAQIKQIAPAHLNFVMTKKSEIQLFYFGDSSL